jgi:hypothetical protein
MNAHFDPMKEACADVQDYLQSKIMKAFEERTDLMRSNPLLYLAYYVEAAGDRRIETDVIAPSVLKDLSELARTMVAKHNGQWLGNPLFPEKKRGVGLA